MNLIEQATRRLEELRRAGIQVPTAGLEPMANGASVMRVVRPSRRLRSGTSDIDSPSTT